MRSEQEIKTRIEELQRLEVLPWIDPHHQESVKAARWQLEWVMGLRGTDVVVDSEYGSCGHKRADKESFGLIHTCKFKKGHPGPHVCVDCTNTWESNV